MKIRYRKKAFQVFLAVITVAMTGCGQNSKDQRLNGVVKIDGSSTVFPISEAIAEEFNSVLPRVRVPIGISGTGGGFSKFIANEIDISNASRPIKEEEAAKAKAANIDYIEIKVAYDGLSVLVNPKNTWVDYLTTEELRKIWGPESTVMKWSDVRPGWPEEKIKFYAPGTDSGTFDYFTEAINGESGAIRTDFTASEDDNVLVQGIAGDLNALGFFGYAFYQENQDILNLVPIENGEGAIAPDFTTIQDGSYAPLSRPIFIYLNKESLKRQEVMEFVTYYLENASVIVPDVGYVALSDEEYANELRLIQ